MSKQQMLFAQITKIDEARREVWGRAAEEVPDNAKEIFDYASSVPHIKAWSSDFEKITDGKSLGNIRAMHANVAAGKVIAVSFDDVAKAVDIGTKIVDDNEWKKCCEGVYTGFSIGGKYLHKWADPAGKGTRYTAGLGEISLVDKPCIKGAVFFDVIKADGTTLQKRFVDQEAAVDSIADMLQKGEISASRLLELAKGDDDEDDDDLTDDDKPDGISQDDWDAMDQDERAQAVADAMDKGAKPEDIKKHNDLVRAIAKELCKAEGKPEAQHENYISAATRELAKRNFSEKKREKDAAEGKAMPDGSFPIENAEDVKNAVKLYGNAKDPAAAKDHIIKRAKAIGATDALPANWVGKVDVHGDLSKGGGNPNHDAKGMFAAAAGEANAASDKAAKMSAGPDRDKAHLAAAAAHEKASGLATNEKGALQHSSIARQHVVAAEAHGNPKINKIDGPTGTALAKGIGNVAEFAKALQSLAWVASSAQSDAIFEGDNSPVPAQMKKWLADGIAIFKGMAVEEASEMVAQLSAAGTNAFLQMVEHVTMSKKLEDDALPEAEFEDIVLKVLGTDGMTKAIVDAKGKGLRKALKDAAIAKYGARNSSGDAANLQKAHDAIVACGAACSADAKKVQDVGALLKSGVISELTNRLGKLETDYASVSSELAMLKSLPAPKKGVLRVIGKEQDVTKVDDAKDVTKIESTPGQHNPDAAFALIKAQVTDTSAFRKT